MNQENKKITVQAVIDAPIEKVWEYWTQPDHINNWYFASEDWQASNAHNNVKVGEKFSITMSAKDNSASFDFKGTYTAIENQSLIEYSLDDGRNVVITFESSQDGVIITESFDPEDENSPEMQKQGWQAILNNFKKYTEARK